MANVYDIALIGLGVANVFCAYRLATKRKNLKILGIEAGSGPAKRRLQISGYLGCLPSSDGKLYLNDLDKISNILGDFKSKKSYKEVKNILNHICKIKIIKDNTPQISLQKKLKKNGFNIKLNDYIQLYPKDIHSLSKYMNNVIDQSGKFDFRYYTEVQNITKEKNIFVITTNNQEYRAKKIVLGTGRSGWRWANDLYKQFGIIENNDTTKFGIRVEMNENLLKDFNKSNCTLFKDNLEIGPFCWNGSVIPEDHFDMAISAFRANEERWKTDKVSFQIIGNINYPNSGIEQTDRIGKLTFLLSNDRVLKEKLSSIINKSSTISILPEYNWIVSELNKLNLIIPEINKTHFHIPTLITSVSEINLGSNLESEVSGMYVVGENTGCSGLLSAMCLGMICGDSISRGK